MLTLLDKVILSQNIHVLMFPLSLPLHESSNKCFALTGTLNSAISDELGI